MIDDCDIEPGPLPSVAPSKATLVVNMHRTALAPDVVYIGRPSLWGNPYGGHAREEAIRLYEGYFLRRVVEDAEFRAATLRLQGKTLACHCKPLPCHGDVIAKWLNSLDKE